MEKVLRTLSDYKKSCALLAGIKLGLFFKLSAKRYSLEELSHSISVNSEMLYLLLVYYSGEGIVEYSEGLWGLTKDFSARGNFRDFMYIAEHEENIYNKWNTPDGIADAVRKGISKREYDLQGFQKNSIEKYNKAMYGNSVHIICFWIRRYIGHQSAVMFLELGRSPGVLAETLIKQDRSIKADVVIFDDFFDSTTQQVQNDTIGIYKISEFKYVKKYTTVALLNTVHYYSRPDLEKLLKHIRSKFDSNAVLCIADFFHSEERPLKSGILIDWITHGGINFVFINELTELLDHVGFNIIKIKNLPELAIDLIFCSIKNENGVGNYL